MSDIEKRIKELSNKIESLQYKQYGLNNELQTLHNELHDLKLQIRDNAPVTGSHINEALLQPIPEHAEAGVMKVEAPVRKQIPLQKVGKNQKVEDFIGTNLISKIGILITIVGIFIGAKYAIDKELISPAMRILSGYIAGAALIVTAIRLKNKYENFSAVLMGGGLAVLYFITYISYGFYGLFPQLVSFLLMDAITFVTVVIALWYNQKIIAVLGQVAAYAIPFLLSDGSGRVFILFSYISIINIGLLILSFKKDWKILYRTAFFLTWLIYASWVLFKTPEFKQASIGLNFLFINFFTFYFTFLSYKVIRRELYNVTEIAVLLVNALLFYFLGYYLVEEIFDDPHILTYFTIANAVIHFAVGILIHRLKLADKSVYQFIIGLGFLFITIAIPVELNGSWVTLLWCLEATILCYIAYKNNRLSYLVIALPMVLIALISLLQDWFVEYPHLSNYPVIKTVHGNAFANLTFWFSFIVSICFGYISWLSSKIFIHSYSLLNIFFKTVVPVIFFFVLYLTFFNEIWFAWDRYIKNNTAIEIITANRLFLQTICLLVYSFLYVAAWLLLNNKYFKRNTATLFLLFAALFCVVFFLLSGFRAIGELRENYLTMIGEGIDAPLLLLYVRYICFAALAILIWNAWKALKDIPGRNEAVKIFSTVFNVVLLCIICNEFIHWMHLAGYPGLYKLGLSIICGLYALVLIFVGIRIRQKHLRISAIILFGVTLLKLFFYDLATLSTVSKTIVLVMLGIILLIVSFLYNKYKGVIFGDDEQWGSV
ncbi:MAG TPA: DUF2339 domain-containing protein [Chitinophagaceae bacterium]|nr:DUF2339 domain-containing protein [Chitinophagaceae bacterium]